MRTIKIRSDAIRLEGLVRWMRSSKCDFSPNKNTELSIRSLEICLNLLYIFFDLKKLFALVL
jgi:hypothetical protein